MYAAKLAPIVHVDQAELEARLSNHKSAFVYVARKVDDATAKQVRDLDLVGISFQDESKRFYPNGIDRRRRWSASSAPTTTGSAGMEYHYDKLLTGKPGSVQVERDPQGNDIPGGEHQVGGGRSAARTSCSRIDSSLQWKTEQALLQGVSVDERARAASRSSSTCRPATCSRWRRSTAPPTPRPRTPRRAGPTRTARVTDVYEPGSTNKVITMAAAIQEGRRRPPTACRHVARLHHVGDKPYDDDEQHPTED